MTIPHVFKYSENPKPPMQVQTDSERLELFLAKKFRISKRYATKKAYLSAVKKFAEFVRVKYNLSISQLVTQITELGILMHLMYWMSFTLIFQTTS